jgi:hypothetical protein
MKMLVATLPDDVKLAPWCRRLGFRRQTAYTSGGRGIGSRAWRHWTIGPGLRNGRRGGSAPSARTGPSRSGCRQIDATHSTLATGVVVEVINVIDDRSRVCVECLALAVCTSPSAWKAFSRVAARYHPRYRMRDARPAASLGDSRDRECPYRALDLA